MKCTHISNPPPPIMKKKTKKKESTKIGCIGTPRIPKEKRNILLEGFTLDLTATQAGKMAKVNRNTANYYFSHFRAEIMEACKYPPRLSGEVEMDQAFFGARKRRKYSSKGKLLEGSTENKVMVFGIVQRKGDVYTRIIKRADKRILIPIIHMVVDPISRSVVTVSKKTKRRKKEKTIIYTDSWRSYNRLVDSGYKHIAINHSEKYSDKKGGHINTIENFWSVAKRRLTKFNGIDRGNFPMYLKECEFRYNNRKDLSKALKRIGLGII